MTYCVNPHCQRRQNEEDSEFCQGCGLPLSLNRRYRAIKPLRPLDKSLYVDVFEAIDQDIPHKPKVLKVLKNGDSKLLQLFQREAQVLGQLAHIGIPQLEADSFFLFPSVANPKCHCLVMEKIVGIDLANWVKDYRLNSTTKALNWLTQLTDILGQLHSNDFFHRDIKPSNIILRPNGNLALIDFGAVRAVTETVYREEDITLVLTPGYAPPEQCNSQAVPQSDFYALGCTFVHLLTGKHPIDLENSDGRVIWRELLPPEFSPRLTDFIEELISHAVSDRPQSIPEMRQRLTDIDSSLHNINATDAKVDRQRNSSRSSLSYIRNLSQKTGIFIGQELHQHYKKIGLMFCLALFTTTMANGYSYQMGRGKFIDVQNSNLYPNAKWLSLSDSPVLLPRNSSWQYYESEKSAVVNNPLIKLAKPALEGTKVKGKVLFDDVVVNEYNRQGELTRTFPYSKLDTNQLSSWDYWSKNKSGVFGTSVYGHDDRRSLYIMGTTDDSLIISKYVFQPRQGYSYRISGWIKGEQVGSAAICRLRIDFLTK
ncbi:MAG: hypothetical protein RLZZ135_1162 [Cyanobacteriota bacterium]